MKLLSQQFGNIVNPFQTLGGPADFADGLPPGTGLFSILNVFFKMAIIAASLYSLFNFILAGYGFMSAGGDPKAIQKAWDKIWQSIVGLLIVAGSLVIAIIIGYLIFGRDNATLLISPRIITP